MQSTIRAPRRHEHTGERREGVALVVVVALLGILFVVGVVFLRTMRFETQSLQVQQQRVDKETAVDAILETVTDVLAENIIGDGGIPYASKQVDGLLDNQSQPRPILPTYGEVLGVHSLLGQAEPAGVDPSNLWQGPQAYRIAGDVEDAARRAPFRAPPDGTQPDLRLVTTAPGGDFNGDGNIDEQDWAIGVDDCSGNFVEVYRDYFNNSDGRPCPDGVVDWVDADGDGINDARQFRLGALGLAEEQARVLRNQVNDPFNLTAEPGVAVKLVDHGGMVNLRYAHPLLINTILADDYKARGIDRASGLSRAYSPTVEEPALRHRGGLVPPRVMPPTTLQGNPFIPDPDCGTECGELGDKLRPALPLLALGQNHWWMLTFNEWFDQAADTWLYNVFTTRQTASGIGGGAYYDRRRFVTTVSHDDLFARNVQLGGGRDVTDRMRVLYRQALGNSDPRVRSALPFLSFYQYPCLDVDADGIADVSTCPDFDGDGVTEVQLAGRLLLSLPWIDEELLSKVQGGVNGIARGGADANAQAAVALLQSAFTRLLLNYVDGQDLDGDGVWDDVPAFFNSSDPNWWGYAGLRDADGNGNVDRFDLVSLLAASMTANAIDFADQDADPSHLIQDANGRYRPNYESPLYDDPSTPVPVRYSDPGAATFGRVIQYVDGFGVTRDDQVFGLERQPYITEVLALAYTSPPPGVSAFAIELFTPYKDTLFDLSRYAIYVVKNGQPFDAGTLLRIDINGAAFLPMPAELANMPLQNRPEGFFCVLEGGNGDLIYEPCTTNIPNNRYNIDGQGQTLDFENGDILYLVKFNTGYDGDFHPVDQFVVDGANIGIKVTYPGDNQRYQNGYSMERRMRRVSDNPADWMPPQQGIVVHKWMAPIAEAAELDAFDDATSECRHSLGVQNGAYPDDDSKPASAIREVEVELADNGSLEGTYPTTGSLMFMMRYANRRPRDVADWGPYTGLMVDEKARIDNGRLPVFDPPDDSGVTRHHMAPAAFPPPRDFDGDGNADPEPGALRNLPWGQALFDYITALPLKPVDDPDFTRPLVDQGGFRVNGRINLNSAPWAVLAGLPVSPAAGMPLPYYFTPYMDNNNKLAWRLKDSVRQALEMPLLTDQERRTGVQLDPYQTYPIGYRLGKAVAAYRESLENELDDLDWNNNPETPGNYRQDRAWTGSARYRRGTGLMTAGELANIRANTATRDPATQYSGYRFDLGMLGRTWNDGYGTDYVREDYASAVSLLAAMSDWGTTRSHVFTVYGTIRGNADFNGDGRIDPEEGQRIEELDKRAIRFEETLDRLPALLGSKTPRRIGERRIAPYADAYSD